MFDKNKQEALKELLEVLEKGVNLLANNNLDKRLYDAFEKYANSTIEMVDEAYNRGFISYLSRPYMPHNCFNHMNQFGYHHISMPHSAMSGHIHNIETSEYREKLKDLLQKIISVAKRVTYK